MFPIDLGWTSGGRAAGQRPGLITIVCPSICAEIKSQWSCARAHRRRRQPVFKEHNGWASRGIPGEPATSRGTHCADPSTAITKHCVCGSRRFVPLPTTRQGHLLNRHYPRRHRCRRVLKRDWKRGCPTSSPEDCGYRKAEDCREHRHDTCERLWQFTSRSYFFWLQMSFWFSVLSIIDKNYLLL